jgi:hypothetical protein
MIGLRIDKNFVVWRFDGKPFLTPGDWQTKDLCIKIVCFIQVVHRETGECSFED